MIHWLAAKQKTNDFAKKPSKSDQIAPHFLRPDPTIQQSGNSTGQGQPLSYAGKDNDAMVNNSRWHDEDKGLI